MDTMDLMDLMDLMDRMGRMDTMDSDALARGGRLALVSRSHGS